jgi:hypothetical protein
MILSARHERARIWDHGSGDRDHRHQHRTLSADDTGSATRPRSAMVGIGVWPGVWPTSTSRGRTRAKADGRILDGRTWDELPRVGKFQEQTLPLW